MEVNLVIPRHKYRSLDGQRRESISLSPEGRQALNESATCSRSATVDLFVRVVHAVIFSDREQINHLGDELTNALDSKSMVWAMQGLDMLSDRIDAGLVQKVKAERLATDLKFRLPATS